MPSMRKVALPRPGRGLGDDLLTDADRIGLASRRFLRGASHLFGNFQHQALSTDRSDECTTCRRRPCGRGGTLARAQAAAPQNSSIHRISALNGRRNLRGRAGGVFGARPAPYLALEIPVVDETATKDELRGQVAADDVEEENEGSSFGLDLEMRRPGGFAPVVDGRARPSRRTGSTASRPGRSRMSSTHRCPRSARSSWSSLVAAWYLVFRPFACKPLGTGHTRASVGALSLATG